MELDPPTCEIYRLGMVPYRDAWQLQDRLAGEIARGERPPALLLLQHPHTFTFGRRGEASHLLWDEAELTRREVAVEWVDRGGDVTYHGPGQLVGYPLLPLAGLGWQGDHIPQADYVGYVRRLEQVLIEAIASLGLVTGQLPGLTGVWIQADVASRCVRCDPARRMAPAKIASIGVKVDVHGISRHGFALNVDPDMTYWEGIIPCGLEGVTMVSLADFLNPIPPMEQVIDRVVASFGQRFRFNMVEVAERFDKLTETH